MKLLVKLEIETKVERSIGFLRVIILVSRINYS